MAALKKGSPVDLLSRTVMQIGGAVPSFWLAMLFMLLFSSYLGWFPVTGYTAPGENFGAFLKCIALPSLVLAIGELGILIRIVRSSMLTALQQDFMMSANVKGLPPARAIVHYALRSAIIAPITISGMQLAKLLGGTVIVETIFALPGIGRLMLTAVEQRDIILLQGIVLFITSMVVLVSLVTGSGGYGRQPHYPYRRGDRTGMKKKQSVSFWAGAIMAASIVAICIISFCWMPADPEKMDTLNRFALPSAAHLLGTDQFGRDVLSRIMEASRWALLVGVCSVTVARAGGNSIIGASAAMIKGAVRAVIMRFIDGMMSFPGILLAMMLVTVLGKGILGAVLAIGLFMGPDIFQAGILSWCWRINSAYISRPRTAMDAVEDILCCFICCRICFPD